MKIFPEWMYRDPADAAARLESMDIRADERKRIRELERELEAARLQQFFFERIRATARRVICAPPEIRMKRARIQALARAAMKEQK